MVQHGFGRVVKLLLLGSASVGKTSLLLRFIDENWNCEHKASATVHMGTKVRRSDRGAYYIVTH